MHVDDDDNEPMLDDGQDLSKLDRGDDLPDEDEGPKETDGPTKKADAEGVDEEDEGDDTDGKPARDDKGRFKKAGDEGEEGEEEEGEEEDEDDESDVPNAKIRISKMKEQRDGARLRALELERELDALRKQAPAKDEPAKKEDPTAAINAELDALYEQVEEARADGDTKLAAQLQRQIDSKNREAVKLEATQIASKATTEAAENARYDALLDQLEADIGALNPKHADHDPKAVEMLEFYTAAHEKMGMKATTALRQAAVIVFGWGSKQQDAPAPKVEQRKVDAKKAIDTQKRQPPDMSTKGVNKDDTKIRVDSLTEEQWDALPESKRAQLRGDMM